MWILGQGNSWLQQADNSLTIYWSKGADFPKTELRVVANTNQRVVEVPLDIGRQREAHIQLQVLSGGVQDLQGTIQTVDGGQQLPLRRELDCAPIFREKDGALLGQTATIAGS